MSGIIRFWFAPVLLLVGGIVLAAVVDGDDGVDLPFKFHDYKNRGFGAGGYDVVAYFDKSEAVPGKQGIEAEFGGARWLFDTIANRDKFMETPRRYIPQYGGHCAWAASRQNGYQAPGDPEAWTVRDGKLYLNYNENIRRGWLADINDRGDEVIVRGDDNWRRFVSTGSFDN